MELAQMHPIFPNKNLFRFLYHRFFTGQLKLPGYQVLAILQIALLVPVVALCCTDAIVGAGRSATGVTLLWKNRDTSHRHNFVARAHGKKYDFTALFNAGDDALSEAWAGVNSAGFAIINSQSYNLAPDTASVADREGLVMAMALGQCATVADFEALLDSIARPMGVQANFGVADAQGNAAWFETSDWAWRRYDVESDSVDVRSNFSLSGLCGAGLGHDRYDEARRLLNDKSEISARFLTDTVSCSGPIPRKSTSAAIVVSTDGTITLRPGYPPLSAKTFIFKADEITEGLSW